MRTIPFDDLEISLPYVGNFWIWASRIERPRYMGKFHVPVLNHFGLRNSIDIATSFILFLFTKCHSLEHQSLNTRYCKHFLIAKKTDRTIISRYHIDLDPETKR